MKKLILTGCMFVLSIQLLLAQASSQENLKRATAKEIGGNTRTEDVIISHIKRKMTSVTWNAQVKGVCYECDADDMVRSVHIVKIDCESLPQDEKKKSELPNGPTIGNTKSASQQSSVSVSNETLCLKYQKLKKAGMGLTIGGGATLLTSVILLGVSSRQYSPYSGYSYRSNPGAYVAGAILITPGLLATGAGIPLWIIGNKQSKKYCAGATSFNLQTTESGLGLSLNF